MPKYTKFEDLPVWKEAARLYNRVLDLLQEPGLPLTPGFRNQLDRAALSAELPAPTQTRPSALRFVRGPRRARGAGGLANEASADTPSARGGEEWRPGPWLLAIGYWLSPTSCRRMSGALSANTTTIR